MTDSRSSYNVNVSTLLTPGFSDSLKRVYHDCIDIIHFDSSLTFRGL